MTRNLPSVCAALLLALAVPQASSAADIMPAATEAPAGAYNLDKAHASVTFRISHLGMSHYTARFTRIDAQLQLDTKHPAASKVTATIDPKSVQTDFPLPQPDFNAVIAGAEWLDAGKYPEMKFTSTSIVMTSPNTARMTGDLSLHGVTKPVTLDVTFNGGMAKMPMGPPDSRIGFSAHGVLKRSDYGMAGFIPKPGTTFGIGDDVEIVIEAEFLRPAS